jgi:hypothetical protein
LNKASCKIKNDVSPCLLRRSADIAIFGSKYSQEGEREYFNSKVQNVSLQKKIDSFLISAIIVF